MTVSANSLFVSLQDRRAAGPQRAHLAAGVLVESELVVLRDVPAGLVDGSADVEVLITQVPAVPGTVERFLPTTVRLLGGDQSAAGVLAPPDGGPVAFLTLAGRSAHPPTLEDDITLAEVQAALAKFPGDPWLGLQSIGVVPKDWDPAPPRGLLEGLPRVERQQRADRVNSSILDSFQICKLIGRCLLPPTPDSVTGTPDDAGAGI